MDREDWEMAERGFLGALGDGPGEPFGTWPLPPHPQPMPKKLRPITHSKQGS